MSEEPTLRVFGEVEMFVAWMNNFDNQTFMSAQAAYKKWLDAEGFILIGDDYTKAVQIILVFLSSCIANPKDRRYLSNPPDDPVEFTILQVNAPEELDECTFWEFLTEANFHEMYAAWRRAQ